MRFPELPSVRLDAWAIALGVVGFGFVMVPHDVIPHAIRLAVACWVGAGLVFVSGFPAVQRAVLRRWQRRAEDTMPTSPLVVLFGKVEPFRSLTTLTSGAHVQHTRVIVKNGAPKETAKAVRVYCELHQPQRYDRWLLSGPFDLHAGEEKVVDVVSWNAGRDGVQFRLGDPNMGMLLDAVETEVDIAEARALGYVATLVVVAESLLAARARCFFGLLGEEGSLTLSSAGTHATSAARLSAA